MTTSLGTPKRVKPNLALFRQGNVTVCHTLREGNHCVDFMAKLGVGSDTEMLYHVSPLDDLSNLLRMDAVGTLYSREQFLRFSFLFSCFCFFVFLCLVPKKKIQIQIIQANTQQYTLINVFIINNNKLNYFFVFLLISIVCVSKPNIFVVVTTQELVSKRNRFKNEINKHIGILWKHSQIIWGIEFRVNDVCCWIYKFHKETIYFYFYGEQQMDASQQGIACNT